MPSNQLPHFRPVSQDEMRRLWIENPTPDVRRLVLEVERYRRLIAEVDGLFGTIHQAWREEVGGDLVALYMLKTIMDAERLRRP